MKVLLALLLAGTAAAYAEDPIARSPELPAGMPWNLDKLSVAPKFNWLEKAEKVRELEYEGEPFNGKPTHVFAYYADPATITNDPNVKGPWPAVVLVHGGGGTAYAQWADLWANRGYAAIAMDLAGMKPDRKEPNDVKKRVRLADGGPGQSHPEKFDTIGTEDLTDDWCYHAVANVILAHSLIRSFPGVDREHTAITGISWGGYTTCIAVSIDSRFKAAVPVYGCGFLNEDSVWLPEFEKLGAEKTARWVKLYDPGQYLPACRVPIFFVVGTNDFAYPLDSFMKSYKAASNASRQIREEVDMKHSHEAGWAPREIAAFIENHTRDGLPLPVVSEILELDGKVTANVTEAPVASASLMFTIDDNAINKHEWRSQEATIDVTGTPKLTTGLPVGARIYFFSVTTAEGFTVTSPVVIKGEVKPVGPEPAKP